MTVRTEKLLSVADVFEIKSRGLVVLPMIPQKEFRALDTKMFVLLRKPDGTEARVLADFTVPRVADPKDIGFACLLRGQTLGDVPVGTEVYRFLEERPNQPAQSNAGSRPSSGDSPASETPSSLGPRG